MVELGGTDLTKTGQQDGFQPDVELLPPVALPRYLPMLALTVVGAGLGFAYFSMQTENDLATIMPPSQPAKILPAKRFVISANDFPGSMTSTEKKLVLGAPYIMNQMSLSEVEKQRLRTEVEKDSVRIGAITLWDNVHEDGDMVLIEGAGFQQELLITHKPDIYFVPYTVGGSILITGVKDGGGGITLGVSTSLGDQFLPPLAPGQIVELQIP